MRARSSPTLVASFSKTILQTHTLLITLGQEDNTTHIRVWNVESWGKLAKAPVLLRTLDVFTGKQAAAEVTLLALHEGTWPQLTYAVGLASGTVLVLRADTGENQASGALSILI